MTELTNINMELDPYLKQMLNAYGNIPERNPESARRTQEKFLTEINNILLDPTVPRSTARRLVPAAWILSPARLKEVFIPVFGRRTVIKGLVMLMTLGIFFFGGAGITAYAASSSLPGDAIYPLKTTIENVRVKLTPDPADQVRLYLDYAGLRLMEIQTLVDTGRYNDIAQAAGEYEIDIQKAFDAVKSLSQTDPTRATALNVKITVTLQGYSNILIQMLVDIPSDVQPVILNIIITNTVMIDQDDGSNTTPVQTMTVTPIPNQGSGDDDGKLSTSAPTATITSTSIILATATSTSSLINTPDVILPTNTPALPPSNSVVDGADATCTGFIGAVTVNNLEVPQGANCTLDGTTVMGNIKIQNGATLIAQRIRVNGNIQADGASYVEVLAGSSVGGNIQLKQGGSARVEDLNINGDIQIESNYGTFSILRNWVGGNIQVFQNSGDASITSNMVNGNLQCKENTPAPTGGNNVVQGNKEDQCAGL